MSDAAPRLDGVRFSVLALGDTAYAQFCAIGKAIDARLEALGGKRATARVDLDLDYAKQAAEWTERALAPADAGPSATVSTSISRAVRIADDERCSPPSPLGRDLGARQSQ
jgi:sulfite reductase (NADPH) flavoprotein alpha-component